jgi:hypothetical protein
MNDEAEKAVEPRSSRDFWGWVCWAAALVAFYILTSGFAQRLFWKRPWGDPLRRTVDVAYAPLSWAYYHTWLHKPLGMYWHLWQPAVFDKSGNLRPIPIIHTDQAHTDQAG